MKNIFIFGEKPARRNLTIADLRDLKGVRQLTQTNPATLEEAAAAVASGIDTLIRGQSQFEGVRAGAPHTFLTAALMLTDFPTDEATIRTAFKYMEAGADAIYTVRRPQLVRLLADEGIPVMGHLGLVPRKSTWVGGLRRWQDGGRGEDVYLTNFANWKTPVPLPWKSRSYPRKSWRRSAHAPR